MAVVHKAGFVWDDPREENIVFDAINDQFYIVDFSIASPIGYNDQAYCRGTPGYTWSDGASSVYDDIRKFAILLQKYS